MAVHLFEVVILHRQYFMYFRSIGTCSGKETNCLNFIVASHISGSSYEGKNLRHWSKFFPLRVVFPRLHHPGKQTGSQKKCLP